MLEAPLVLIPAACRRENRLIIDWKMGFWSGRWESNPRPKLGKLLYCHCTTPALRFILPPNGHLYSASLYSPESGKGNDYSHPFLAENARSQDALATKKSCATLSQTEAEADRSDIQSVVRWRHRALPPFRLDF